MKNFREMLQGPRPLFGTMVHIPVPEIVEIFAAAGIDFVFADTEHTPYAVEQMAGVIRAADAGGLALLVRAPGLDPHAIRKILDMGAAGVVVPGIETAQEAQRAVACAKYPPAGIRGACPYVRGNGYGFAGPDCFGTADAHTAVVILVESEKGYHNFEEILQVPGVNGIFLGGVDLAVSMGLGGNTKHPRVRAALEDMVAKAVQKGVPVGAGCFSPEEAQAWLALGVGFIPYGCDIMMLADYARTLRGMAAQAPEARER